MRPSLPAPCSFWGSIRRACRSTGILRVLRRTRRACESGIDYAKTHQPQASQPSVACTSTDNRGTGTDRGTGTGSFVVASRWRSQVKKSSWL